MLVQFGRKSERVSLVGLLSECHERIRSFIALAQRVTQERLAEDDVRTAAMAVRRYFVEALPLHVADEEQSLTPRLRGRSPTLDAALAQMGDEHSEHAAGLAELVSACEALAHDPGSAAARAQLALTATRLGAAFDEHLRHEEVHIFPAIERELDQAAQADVVRELRARRQPGY